MSKYAELKREFKKAGCYKYDEGGNHEWWYSPITNNNFQMGRHNQQEVPSGTEKILRRQAGVPKKH